MAELPFGPLKVLLFALGTFFMFCLMLGLIDVFTYLSAHVILEWKP